jgi:hypothetical protein
MKTYIVQLNASYLYLNELMIFFAIPKLLTFAHELNHSF